jgi:hypothetical protein
MVSLPVELWPLDQTEAFLMARLDVHCEAQTLPTDALPPCTPEERWMTATKWAVKKPGGKNAVRGGVKDTKYEAEMMIEDNPGWFIEERPGISKRCPRYCAAGRAGLCSQWNAERAALDAAGTPVTSDEDEPALS